MDELRGPTIQIVLNVKEGLGFGFLKCPFIVSGSLNGYMLETDPVIPTHAPAFDAELVWEADKRRFRSLRVQNVPVKIEVYTTATQGKKDKIGYLLLSLLGAQPCPSNKIVDIKHTWHKLLGVKSEGKCCHPQLLLSLTIEDRISTPTPRNELRIFHSNEVAFPSAQSNKTAPTLTNRSMLLTLNEYITESKKTASSPNLQPKLICDEGLIQIGSGNDMFVLALVIGTVENLDLLLSPDANKDANCYVTYSVFTHTIMTDRVNVPTSNCIQFNQRTSLRVSTSLTSLSQYFTECPYLVAKLCVGESEVGICSLDLRKLIPTDDINHFIRNFCNNDNALTIQERCYILPYDNIPRNGKAYMDVELSLKYVGVRSNVQKPVLLTARSATQLENGREGDVEDRLGYRSGSCTNLDQDVGGVAYTNIAAGNTNRYTNASGDAVLNTNELAEIIKKMCESFTLSQEKLLAKIHAIDAQVQCEKEDKEINEEQKSVCKEDSVEKEQVRLETSKSDSCIKNKDIFGTPLTPSERNTIMQQYVEELEDWKERQQQLFKVQLKRKEDYHLDLLAAEWFKRRSELETKLSKGIEQCRHLAADLSRATDDFRLRGYRNMEREKKLLEAKKALETHYSAKYQELREASQKMEDDMNHRLKLKDMSIDELKQKIQMLEKQNDGLKNNLKNFEKDAETKYSGLTKDQTASLIQELRCLEEKYDSVVQSKAFFKEQWGRAVRELHLTKLRARRRVLANLRHEREQLRDTSLDPIQDEDSNNQSSVDINKLKDDFYVDILAKTPMLDTHCIMNAEEMDLFEDFKNVKSSANDKLAELITRRDQLIQEENPDEDIIKQLNHEIRNMLINCGN